MRLVLIFLIGVGILGGAIILNFFAGKLGIFGWYEFLKNPGEASFLSYIWLFFLYPLSLGAIAYFSSKLLKL